MRISSELLLTFLLNACWQIPVIAGAAALGSWLLKGSSARYRHWIWVTALLLSLLLPVIATSRVGMNNSGDSNAVSTPFVADFSERAIPESVLSSTSFVASQTSAVSLNWFVAQAIIFIYFAFLSFGAYRFLKACFTTRRIKRTAHPAVMNQSLSRIAERCQELVGIRDVQILCSESLPVPATLGVFKPVIILPESLVQDGNQELLTSAIAHEFIHVARRDYVLNLAYELVYLLLAFNPASALLRRRIKQTRELSCDELVAERVIEPGVYARSLVTLASSAPPLSSLSINATVGIADADILEVRVMSLMNKTKLISRSRKLFFLIIALLLVVPSVTAMALAMRFNVDPLSSVTAQQQEQEQKEKEKAKEQKEKMRSPEFEAGWRAGQKEAERTRERFEPGFAERSAREEEELKAREIMRAELVKLARVPMDQAIQIATSQYPGKVLESNLLATHWEGVGQLARDGKVLYHIEVLSADDNSTIHHVWVNAVDGAIAKVETELPRKMKKPEEPK